MFACAVIEAYYEVNKALADTAKRDETLIAIGEKFSNLDLEQMETVVEQTKFYGTPDKGLAVLTGANLPKIMEKVVSFCTISAAWVTRDCDLCRRGEPETRESKPEPRRVLGGRCTSTGRLTFHIL